MNQIEAMLNAASRSRHNTMTLGEMIDILSLANPEAEVSYDFPDQYPTRVDSWRGVYAQLALGHGSKPIAVSDMLADLNAAVGATFTGWKGGEYEMDRETPVHVANPGQSGQTRIHSIDISRAIGDHAKGGKYSYAYVIIHTRYERD
jgi:hypothetical protein